MAYVGYITQIKNLRKHPNADRLQLAECFGNTVVLGMDYKDNQIGVYFPEGGQLSEEFCKVNDLVRRKDENGNPAGGYLDPDKRNIKALRLRGEKSDGLFLPLTCLANFTTISNLKIGDTIDTLNGVEICRKYIPHSNKKSGGNSGSVGKRAKANFAPTFYEHIDTAQLAYNMDVFKAGDIVQLTLKMHGTSGRTGYLPLIHHKQSLFDKIFHRIGKEYKEYGYVTGTRRVVLDATHTGGYYDDNSFREEMAKKFEGKLHKGEICYYEIVAYQGPNGAPIMASGKVPSEYKAQYGDVMEFSYGCKAENGYNDEIPCCDVYVYRMTMVNEDGDMVEYSPAEIRYRCEQIGVKYVPEFETFVIPNDVNAGEYVMRKVEEYYDGPDPIGKTHVREGVVARILNRNSFAVYKHKNYLFKYISGLIVSSVPEDAKISEDILEEM